MLHLDMGKYAVFVWTAWALSALVLAGLTGDTVLRAKKAKAALARAEEASK